MGSLCSCDVVVLWSSHGLLPSHCRRYSCKHPVSGWVRFSIFDHARVFCLHPSLLPVLPSCLHGLLAHPPHPLSTPPKNRYKAAWSVVLLLRTGRHGRRVTSLTVTRLLQRARGWKRQRRRQLLTWQPSACHESAIGLEAADSCGQARLMIEAGGRLSVGGECLGWQGMLCCSQGVFVAALL